MKYLLLIMSVCVIIIPLNKCLPIKAEIVGESRHKNLGERVYSSALVGDWEYKNGNEVIYLSIDRDGNMLLASRQSHETRYSFSEKHFKYIFNQVKREGMLTEEISDGITSDIKITWISQNIFVAKVLSDPIEPQNENKEQKFVRIKSPKAEILFRNWKNKMGVRGSLRSD